VHKCIVGFMNKYLVIYWCHHLMTPEVDSTSVATLFSQKNTRFHY